MDYSALTGIHFAKDKRCSARANAICCKVSHRSKLCFSGRAKTFNVADEALALSEGPPECLIDQVLYGLQEFATLDLQQAGIRTTQIQ
jgi:hypothetical protein